MKSLVLLLAVAGVAGLGAQAPAGTTLDETVAPGANYDKAEFRLWYPSEASRLKALVVLVPGSNGDARNDVNDAAWQAFATKHQLGLVGVRLTDKPHEQSFIEHYINVSQGSGQAFLDALAAFAAKSKHAEIAVAPLFLWGMSAGGEFNYEFTNWKPERVAGFIVNKGGIYYTALTSRAARSVPGMLYVGGKDLESRINIIAGLFAVNRRGGALWGFAEEPAAGHIVGKSKDVSLVFYEDLIPLRIDTPPADPSAPVTLKPIDEKAGFIGDLKAKTFQPAATAGTSSGSTAWLPTERVAKAWMAMVQGG